MKRWVLLATAVAVLAVIALYLTRDGSRAETTPASGAHASEQRPPAAPSLPPTSAPETATGGAAAGEPAAPVTREYRLADGTRVRDHRTGTDEEFAIPSTPPPRPVQRLASDEVAKVHNALYPMAMECAAAVPDAEVGANAVLQIRMNVHVAEGSLVAADVVAQARGLGEKGAAVEACARDKAASIALDVGRDHPPVAGYPLTFPYRVRR